MAKTKIPREVTTKMWPEGTRQRGIKQKRNIESIRGWKASLSKKRTKEPRKPTTQGIRNDISTMANREERHV